MLSIPSSDSFNKAHDGRQLRSTVSEQSIELSIWNEDDKKALVSPKSNKSWKPLTQKAFFLVPTILASGALIAVLQVYLERSNQDAGIMFAPRIDELPLNQTFCYLYLPTIVSLVLSFVWTWIDLDIKRLEPFVQLSRPNGALGKNSVLLHYPFDFVAFVPFAAVRRRHWPVFSASLAVVLIFWGLTPLQSSIFATRMTNKTLQVPAISSKSHLSLQDQKTTLTGLYAQSVYNIAWLNESLPPFMSRQGMLAPFSLENPDGVIESGETWTATTLYYSVDIDCEVPTWNASYIQSSWGCSASNTLGLFEQNIKEGQYNTMYTGYWYEESMDSYLNGRCPLVANQTFLVRYLAGNSKDQDEEPQRQYVNTTLWCRPTYYQQQVNATVSPPQMNVVDIVPVGSKQPLPGNLINITDLEWSMSQGYELNINRGSFPTSSWPDPHERVHTNFPEVYWTYYLPFMASLALGAYQRPTAEYLDAETLKDSYQAAFRLLLARKLADILSTDFNDTDAVLATRHYQTQAVIMVPAFVYVVQGFLATTTIIALLIFSIPSWKKTNLVREPATIASLMALTSEDPFIIQKMSEKDGSTSEELEQLYEKMPFVLKQGDDYQEPKLCCLDPQSQPEPTYRSTVISTAPILPPELSWLFGSVFLVLQGSIMAALVYTCIRSSLDNGKEFNCLHLLRLTLTGLPLPSDSLFVNQILVKYLPMVVGAFFEPIFTWLTRTLCMLQPYEQLRKGDAAPSRSITADYSSLPPQAVMFRALKAGHLSLASLCCLMTLLANVVSVAFSSLLYERATLLSTPRNFTMGYQLPINATGIPNSTYEHFYVVMSNVTAGTPLPAWTDESFFYLPFQGFDSSNTSTTLYSARTPAIGASLDCFAMEQVQAGWSLSSTGKSGCGVEFAQPTSNRTVVPDAVESVLFLGGHNSHCDLTVAGGWGRLPTHSVKSTAEDVDASWVGCQPRVTIEFPLNSSAILDPQLPPPSFNITAPVFKALYATIFATVLGTHIQTIFKPSDESVDIEGFVLAPEPRIFVSSPMFILSIAILGIYILFTVALYVRRPWKILPRMPTTIASQIPFFAASHTLQDFSVISDTSERARSSDAQGLRQRYGYGRFIGTDGKAHIGIEREPLVQILTKKDLSLMQRNASSS
ncbi:hypothetical protein D6C76_06406 [Aureobasidium pullulans]|nr:hypothetical protein D6C76_06406 [Aureobasidium pullulans]